MNPEEVTTALDAKTMELCCLVCLQLEDLMVHIYDGCIVEDLQSDISTLLERCGGIKTEKSDNLPKFLCEECTSELLIAAKFRDKCERAQQVLGATGFDKDFSTNMHREETEGHLPSQTEGKTDLDILDTPSNFLDIPIGDLVESDLEEREASIDLSTSTGEEELTYLELSGDGAFHEDTDNKNIDAQTETLEREIPKNVFILKKLETRYPPEEVYTCDSCGAVFVQAANLQRHLEKVHFLVQPYVCANCGHTFSLEESYKSHYNCCSKSNKFGSNIKSNFLTKTETTSTQRECVYCGKHLQSTYALNMHLRIHTGERPYKCTQCPKAFKTQSACSMHLKRHAKNPDYACTVCSKTFYETSNLTAHMRTHTGEKPHSCSLCNKRFSRVFLLQLHMRTHTGEKPYQCLACNRGFAQLCDLRNHERTHTGERPFKCAICSKAFIKRYALTAHMERHAVLHSEETDTVDERENKKIVETMLPEVENESVNYMMESSMLEGDSYFLSKCGEESFCDLTYEEVSPLTGPNQELSWNDFIVEEI